MKHIKQMKRVQNTSYNLLFINIKNLRVMKKFTKKAMMLLLFTTFASLLAIQAQTVKRYVFELAGYPIDDPNWKQEWIDLRPDNYERSLLLWSATLVNATPLGTGSLGQNAPYKAFTVNKIGGEQVIMLLDRRQVIMMLK